MGVSCLISIIPSSHFNTVFNYVLIVCCLSFLHPRFPTTVASSRLGGNDTDQHALLAFKAKVRDDPFQILSSWNRSIHFCQWHGISCGRRHQRVTMLDLRSRKLVGSLSPHIGNLSFLRVLKLENNSFVGEIPPELGRLPRLQSLALHNNSVSGKIPANLSGCSNLVGFNFGNNKLVGPIPAELGSLSKLRKMFIIFNSLSGEIPHSFVNLTSLAVLYAFGNNIVGSIPDDLGQLTNLEFVSLGSNRLSGTIPPSIFNRSSLTVFDVVDNNHINGSLPPFIGLTLPNLQYLGLSDNQFTGPIPRSISNASNMEVFVIDGNNFNGKVPTLERLHKLQFVSFTNNSLGNGRADDLDFLSSLTNTTLLRILALDKNKFGGTLPESISNLSTKLEFLAIADNPYILGSIPAGIGNLINLNRLSMWGNQLTGNIPMDIGKLYKLQEWNFGRNKFNGSIPLSVENLTLLTRFSLSENNFQGSIPSGLGKMQNLLLLDLGSNNFSGTIPPEVIGLSSLSVYLDLSKNHLSGYLPMEVGNLINLGVLDVSDNMLFGEIPNTLGSCVMLQALYMEGNFFQGFIPSSLHLRGIQYLDLSRNNLSGEIPRYLTGLDLKKLNLSFNNFEGEVPIEGIFKNTSAISIMGNSKLCGGVLELQLPRCNFRGTKKSRSTFILKLVIPLSCGFLGVISALGFIYFYWFRKSKKMPASSLPKNSLLKVSYQSLLKSTNGFSSNNLIGVGSFGSVYKGIIDQDGTAVSVAVKVLNLSRQGAFKSFLSECEALRNIKHRNLVKVLTACSSTDYQGNDFKALVYELMVNGNLDEWLHPVQKEYEVDGEPKNLSLLQRVNISIDVASALDYLHHHAHNPIIHCDLKPSNVLLNMEMTAHVGDFGLVRFLLNDSHSKSTHQASSSIGLRGSVGYTAPEYGIGSAVSTSGDVYSYGILLLEMFTGKRPTDQMFNDNFNLHNYVKMALPGRLADIADPILLQHAEKGEISTNARPQDQSHSNSYKIQECLSAVLDVGLSCSEETPSERLGMSEIVAKLHVIRDNFFGTGGRRTGLEIQS